MTIFSRIFARFRRPPEQWPTWEFPKFPVLVPPQVAMICVEASTGIPLNLDFQRHRWKGGEVYHVFNSLDDARMSSNRIVEECKMVECVLYDHAQGFIEEIFSRRPDQGAQ